MDWLNPENLWTLFCVPLAVLLFLGASWQRRKVLRRLGDRDLVHRLMASVRSQWRWWKATFFVVGLAFLTIALSGPQVGTKLREVKREGVDIVVALDVSLSMMAEDVAPSRLERSKNEIKKLLTELRGDRVGLVVFAGDAFLQCPLTTDYGAVRLFLDVANSEMLSTPGTDFGAALNTAIQAFDTSAEIAEGAASRALLIVSDGENHVADLNAIIEKAREERIIIFTTGVGETGGAPIPLYRDRGQIVYKKDEGGNIVHTRLEEKGLRELAADGAYFQIARTSSSLLQIIPALERLDQAELGAEEFEEYDNKYQWPLFLAWLVLFMEGFLLDRKKEVSALQKEPQKS